MEFGKQTLLSLLILENPECLLSVKNWFDICKLIVYQLYGRVCRAVVSHPMSDFIYFPLSGKAQEVVEVFERKRSTQGVLEVIDGTHMLIKGPQNHSKLKQYINWKGSFTVQSQFFCDTSLLITNDFCSYLGSVHDVRVLCNSQFCHEGELNPANSYILGNVVYQLKTWLLTPFCSHLTTQQRRYNVAHSSTRMVVERCIRLLEGQLRKLKTPHGCW